MKPSSFGFPISIKKHEWPFNSNFIKREIISVLNNFFGFTNINKKQYEFYEVTRPNIGLVNSIKVLSVLNKGNKTYYTLRLYKYPDPNIHIDFNLPLYQKNRIEQLVQTLHDHYPITFFVDSVKYLIILQEFLFYPICTFTNYVDIINLLEIILLASKGRILLDYNQNHWLSSEFGHLYYVDIDYMGEKFYSDQNFALRENLNQSMAFLDLKNCYLLPQALKEYSLRGSEQEIFVKTFRHILKSFLESCKDNLFLSDKLREKIDCLYKAVD